jgi:hypothetical protein
MSENRKLAAILVSDATNRLFGHRSRIVKRNADLPQSERILAPFMSLSVKPTGNALPTPVRPAA